MAPGFALRIQFSRGGGRQKWTGITVSNVAAPCPCDQVNRQFRAGPSSTLWVGDFIDVSTWQGFVCVAFVIDVFAKRIVGRKLSSL